MITRQQVRDFIAGETLAVFGSISPEGKPQSALVGIAVTEDLEIIFDTLRSTRKFRNIQHNGASSFVIGCTREISVQFEGVARELTGDEELARYRQIYFAKWPDGPTRLTWEGITYIAVKPTWIRYSDYLASPPVIEEMWIGKGLA
jgi:Pyridoxamine 5'-phosphate oxidase